jgi:hypothetical protein
MGNVDPPIHLMRCEMKNRQLIVELAAIVAAIATISTLILISLGQYNYPLTVPWSIS